LTVPPLTVDERAWIRTLRRVFARMPRRLMLVECANGVMVVDRDAAVETEMHDGGADRDGIVLARIAEATMKVTSVSG